MIAVFKLKIHVHVPLPPSWKPPQFSQTALLPHPLLPPLLINKLLMLGLEVELLKINPITSPQLYMYTCNVVNSTLPAMENSNRVSSGTSDPRRGLPWGDVSCGKRNHHLMIHLCLMSWFKPEETFIWIHYLGIRIVYKKSRTYGLHRTSVAMYVLEDTLVFNWKKKFKIKVKSP